MIYRRLRPTHGYTLRKPPLLVRLRPFLIAASRFVGAVALVAALLVADRITMEAEMMEREQQAAAALAKAEAELRALSDWHRNNTARVTLEGNRATVARMAQQVANVLP